jgi:small subunit ribosomal protein S2
MPRTNFDELLEAGVHFGHLKRKWNPAMAPYIFMERNGIHIIDLHKTVVKIDEAASALKQIAKSGRKILFVATKKQAKDIVDEKITGINMPFVTERWPGGMLTNFPTIRKSVKKMSIIDKMEQEGTFGNLAKRERLQVMRQRAKLEKNFGSITDLTRLPAALFVVDVMKEYIAVREAKRLNIPVFAIVDTNSDPNTVDFAIPANDDASKSISLIIDIMARAIQEGLDERKVEKEKEPSPKEKKPAEKKDKSGAPRRARTRKPGSDEKSDEEKSSEEQDKKTPRPRRQATDARIDTSGRREKGDAVNVSDEDEDDGDN